jgi:hypothetical protein
VAFVFHSTLFDMVFIFSEPTIIQILLLPPRARSRLLNNLCGKDWNTKCMDGPPLKCEKFDHLLSMNGSVLKQNRFSNRQSADV